MALEVLLYYREEDQLTIVYDKVDSLKLKNGVLNAVIKGQKIETLEESIDLLVPMFNGVGHPLIHNKSDKTDKLLDSKE
jgi:hypothetical protein